MFMLISALAFGTFDDIPTKGGKAVTAIKQDAPPQDLDEAERALREAEDAIRRANDRAANVNRVPGTPLPSETEALMRKEMEEAQKALERAAKAESSRAPSAPPATPSMPPAYASPWAENTRLKEAREASEAQMYKIILEERARLANELGARYSATDRDLDLPTQAAAVAPRYPYNEMPLYTPSSNAYVPIQHMTPSYLGGDSEPYHRLMHMGAVRGELEHDAAGRNQKSPDASFEDRWGDAAANVKRALRP